MLPNINFKTSDYSSTFKNIFNFKYFTLLFHFTSFFEVFESKSFGKWAKVNVKNISKKDNTECVSINIPWEKQKFGLNHVHYIASSHIIETKAKSVQLACKNIKKHYFLSMINSMYFHKQTLSAYLVNSSTFSNSYLSSCPNWKTKVRINAKKSKAEESKKHLYMYHDAVIQ